MVRYFEWMGAAVYTADRRAGAMHGKQFFVDSVQAGIDETNIYGRLDFTDKLPETDFDLVVNLESWTAEEERPRRVLRLDVKIAGGTMHSWKVTAPGEEWPLASLGQASEEAAVAFARNFEFKLPLSWLLAMPVASHWSSPAATKFRLRFSLWQGRLPVDALPLEGWIELQLLREQDLMSLGM